MTKLQVNSINQLVDLDLRGVETLVWNINHPIEDIELSADVTVLMFGYGFNQPVERLNLGEVRVLHLGYSFNQPIERLHLRRVERLTLSWLFNQPVEQLNLRQVKELRFNWIFNQPIQQLDLRGVETLRLSICFNHPIETIKAPKLRRLTFGTNFNQSIDQLTAGTAGLEIFFPVDSMFDQPICLQSGNITVHLPDNYRPKPRIPEFSQITPSNSSHTGESNCGVCHSDGQLITTECGQPVCYRCFCKWLEYDYRCPYCRQSVDFDKIRRC